MNACAPSSAMSCTRLAIGDCAAARDQECVLSTGRYVKDRQPMFAPADASECAARAAQTEPGERAGRYCPQCREWTHADQERAETQSSNSPSGAPNAAPHIAERTSTRRLISVREYGPGPSGTASIACLSPSTSLNRRTARRARSGS
jgi:hypothetical protein